ncbi:MAG: SMP-30/gluconolactonase/LRE family protein [Betaproteobacteria bacterium]|nr:SMP-30/gluconolactonase/LRE family protein [Betaproteobacteria bacterium]
MRFDPQTGDCVEWRSGTNRTNCILFDARGRLHGCSATGRAIVRFEPDGSTTVVADRVDGKRLNTPNDLAIDHGGRIWFSNPWNEPLLLPGMQMELQDESVMLATPSTDGTYAVRRATFDTTSPTGVLLSADQRTLYVSQCDYGEDRIRELRAYPILADGTLGPYAVLHQFGRDFRGVHRAVDGMCLDANGNIVATAGYRKSGPGPMVYVFTPTGRILESHPVPVDRPTNCTFGDADLRTLYVTTGDGFLFRVRTGRQGWNLHP